MTVEVRPIRFADDVSAFDVLIGHDTDSPRPRRTLVATDGAALVGAASATWSNRHPDLVQGFVEVLATHRRSGVGSTLAAALRRLAGDGLACFVDGDDPVAAGFLRSAGFAPVVDSWTVRAAVDARSTAAIPDDTAAAGIAIDATRSTDEVEAFFERIYGDRHGWAGRYVPSPAHPWIRVAGTIVTGTLFVARREGAIVAASCLTKGELSRGADAFLPPTGSVLDVNDPAASAVVRAVVTATLRAGAARGVTRVNVEFDSPYVELVTLMDSLATEPVSHRTVWKP
ncbi:MAG: GNAT family N-acetyltransferase [Actinomycetota bacterium]|nr:GNAT family N-acetyltransferase [Actinomycetota bacterium]